MARTSNANILVAFAGFSNVYELARMQTAARFAIERTHPVAAPIRWMALLRRPDADRVLITHIGMSDAISFQHLESIRSQLLYARVFPSFELPFYRLYRISIRERF